MNTNVIESKVSVTSLIKDNFPNSKFSLAAKKSAGKLLKKSLLENDNDYSKVIDFLKKQDVLNGDFKPPAFCNIVWTSRPFEDMPICKANTDIQKYIYALRKDQIGSIEPGVSKTSHNAWFEATGVDNHGYTNVQGLNAIFQNAIGNYKGCEVKANNKNKKIVKKNKWREQHNRTLLELVNPFTNDGYLLNPPGAGDDIYCCQNMYVRPVNPVSDKEIITQLPIEYRNYALGPNDEIPNLVPNRLLIPKGSPGYIPEHQRAIVNSHKSRIRFYGNKNEKAILYLIRIDEDYVVIDARGLLRNLNWRKLIPNDALVKCISEFFTTDPIIHTKTNVVQFSYKEGKVPVTSRAVITYKKAPEILKEQAPIALLSIDLGQNNPVAAKISSITYSDKLDSTKIGRRFVPDNLLVEIQKMREAHDTLYTKMHNKAISQLSEEQIEEVIGYNMDVAAITQNVVCSEFEIDSSRLPWAAMGNRSTYIADFVIENGLDQSKIWTKYGAKRKCTDEQISHQFRPHLSKETNDSLRQLEWQIQRNNPGFVKLAKRKLDLFRHIRNHFLNLATKTTGLQKIAIVVEKLNMGGNFFSGHGRRNIGWDEFFTPKKNDKWIITQLHKAFTEISTSKGIIVIEAAAAYTSQMCTNCGHIDKDNRAGQYFKCLECGFKANADLDIATDNLEKIALTGVALTKPKLSRERLGDAKTTGGARKPKLSK